MTTPTTKRHLWYPETIGGHQPFCVYPGGHAPAEWCKADDSEPQTLRGEPSKAWHRDHPKEEESVTTPKTVHAAVDIHGPNVSVGATTGMGGMAWLEVEDHNGRLTVYLSSVEIERLIAALEKARTLLVTGDHPDAR